MKIAKFTITRGQVDNLIHSLKALAKLHDNPSVKTRFVACNFIEMQRPKRLIHRIFNTQPNLRVIIQIDKGEKHGKDNN